MGLRKAGAYSRHKAVPFTRKSKVQSKHYLKTVPPSKIVKFNMGDSKGFEAGKYNHTLNLLTTHYVQIRDNAIEASRQLVLKELENTMPGAYFFRIGIHPHHVLRENRMITGAGADRMQTGMQLSFGVNIGRAAIAKEGEVLMFVALSNEKNIAKAREILRLAATKIPCKTRMTYEKK